jgi:hypothetical protein
MSLLLFSYVTLVVGPIAAAAGYAQDNQGRMAQQLSLLRREIPSAMLEKEGLREELDQLASEVHDENVDDLQSISQGLDHLTKKVKKLKAKWSSDAPNNAADDENIESDGGSTNPIARTSEVDDFDSETADESKDRGTNGTNNGTNTTSATSDNSIARTSDSETVDETKDIGTNGTNDGTNTTSATSDNSIARTSDSETVDETKDIGTDGTNDGTNTTSAETSREMRHRIEETAQWAEKIERHALHLGKSNNIPENCWSCRRRRRHGVCCPRSR